MTGVAYDLFAECLEFVQEQSGGEWGDKLERDDARKLMAFVQAHRIAALEEARQVANGFADMCDGTDDPHSVTAKTTATSIAECISDLKGAGA